jgi:hypothetical protein
LPGKLGVQGFINQKARIAFKSAGMGKPEKLFMFQGGDSAAGAAALFLSDVSWVKSIGH